MSTIVLTKTDLENTPCQLRKAWAQVYKKILEQNYKASVHSEGYNEYVLCLDGGEEEWLTRTFYLSPQDFILLQ